MNETEVAKSFQEMLDDLLEETGASLSKSTAWLAQYAAERATHLAALTGDPNFAIAVRAERDAVGLEAGLAAVRIADASDARVLGLIQGGLALAALALSGGVALSE